MDELTDTLAGPRQLKEPGSPAWCLQTVLYLKDHVRHVDEQWRQAEQILDELRKFKAWRVIPPGCPYGTLNKMLEAEIGLDGRAIKTAIRKAELAAHGRPKKGDNVTFLSGDRGNSETYTVRRLRRDHPDLADRVEQGALSANAAAIEAGFRSRTKSIRIDDPESAARTLRIHMKPDQLAELIRILTQESP
jgi:hypothetical protein